MFFFLQRHFTFIVCIQGFWHWVCWKCWKVIFWEWVCGWRKLTLPGFVVSFYLVHFSLSHFFICLFRPVYVYTCMYIKMFDDTDIILNCNTTRDSGKLWFNCNSYHFGWTFVLGHHVTSLSVDMRPTALSNDLCHAAWFLICFCCEILSTVNLILQLL